MTLGLNEEDVFVLNFAFYLALCIVVIIAIVVFVLRHRRIPPPSIRNLFYVFLLGFVLFRFAWSCLKLFTSEDELRVLDFFFGRTAFCFFFSAFISVALIFAEVSFAMQRRARIILRVIVSIANALVYSVVFVVLIIVISKPEAQNEGSVFYEFSILFVIIYSLTCAVIFLFFSCLTTIRILRLSSIKKTKRLLLNSLLLISVSLVCSVCFTLRTFIFLYRPVTGRLFPVLIFYQYGYWIPEIPVVLFLLILMNEPKRKGLTGGYRKATNDVTDNSERWARKFSNPISVQNRETTAVVPLVGAMEEESDDEAQYLLVSSAVQLKGTAQPRVAMFYHDPRVNMEKEAQTTEIVFENVSEAQFRTLFDINLSNDSPGNELWFGVYSSIFEEDDAHEDEAYSQIKTEDGEENIDELIDQIDPETNETCIGFASISLDEIRNSWKDNPSFSLDLIGLDNLAHGTVLLNVEKTKTIPEEKLSHMFIRNYKIESENGPLYLEDEMGESPMAFSVAAQLLAVAVERKREEIIEFKETFQFGNDVKLKDKSNGVANFKNIVDVADEREATEKWYSTELQIRQNDLEAYEEALALYVGYTNQIDELTFKPSAYKGHKQLAFIATNLHYQEMRITSPNSDKVAVYDHVTVGAPSAHVYKFGNGGLFNLETQFAKLDKKRGKQKKPIERAQLERKLESLAYEISRRRDVVTCQAVAALCTCFAKRVKVILEENFPGRLEQYIACGFLIHFEGLLSTYGSEIGMLGDFARGVSSLELFLLQLVPGEEGDVDCSGLPCKATLAIGESEQPVFQIALPPYLWDLCPPSVQYQEIEVFPILFTQGINEFQSIANKIGETSLQDNINKEGFPRLLEYSKRYIDFWKQRKDHDGTSYNSINVGVQRVKQLVSHPKRDKVVDLLVIPSDICRKMGGGRVTCCKSAKDRTSMSVTYEQVRILAEKHDMNEDLKEVADALRSTGIRRMNAHKNIGKNKFAFNNFQRKLLPYMYKPPTNTIGGGVQT